MTEPVDHRAHFDAVRATNEELGRRLAERLAPQNEEKRTINRYEAFQLPRGNVVVEIPSRKVEATFDTFAEAQLHAAQLNEWLERRPAPDRRYRMFVPPPEPTEARLVELIDRMYDIPESERDAWGLVAALIDEARAGAA